ncbi:MAG: hypothetical protein ABSE86_12100 [Bryobacteraceae bacterium]|jgi:hypothetical protein
MLRSGILALILGGCWARGTVSAAEDSLPPAQLKVDGAVMDVSFAPGKLDLPEEKILAWIKTAAEAVTEYFGRFPVPHPRIYVRPREGRGGIFQGTTYGSDGGFTRISVGEHTTQQELDSDWMMTHELTHMAFPDIAGDDREHHWIEEGMATYIEPIARCQIGVLKVEQVWGEMVRYMPQGLPQPGDQGLDNTHTWGRTYWGGALYWMMADIQIRQRTQNRKGLEDAMRAIVAAGGTIVHEWPIEKVLEVGDRSTGTTVLADLYKRMKATPVEIDLDDLWAKLGVQMKNGVATFDDKAPLAEIRKAIAGPSKR